MIGVKQTAKAILVLTMALCFALSAGIVWASSDAGHAPVVEHAQDAAAGHGEVDSHASGAKFEKSLAWPKVKDLLLRIMNFAVLVFILVKFAAKPIASSLSGRRKAIKEEIEGLEARRDAADKSYKEFTAKLSTVEKDIDSIVEKAVAQAELEKAKIIEKAEQAANDIKRSAEMAIQNEVTEAKRNLKNEIADGAAVMAEELIVKNLTDEDQVKIIEGYLNKVGAVQ